MRIAIGIEYDGSLFHGWQSQPFGNTVQDALELAVSEIAGVKTMVHAAGRTDAGVHALAQVAHFDVQANRPISAWIRGVNSHLPQGVAVLWARQVPDDFHSRFSATARGYRYLLLNHPVRPGLLMGKVGWCHRKIDIEAMREGAGHLIGEHDFSSFRAAECQAKSPVRQIFRLEIAQQGDLFIFEINGNAFLHHMVRNIVGSLLVVGVGRERPDWIARLLAARSRRLAAPTFSPAGLYLAQVEYDAKWELPAAENRGIEWGVRQ